MGILFLLLSISFTEVEGCGDPEEQNWKFVGCAYSPNECYYSCPGLGNYKAEVDPKQCFMPNVEWACYCPMPE